MTVSNTNNRDVYAGSGSSGPYPITFDFIDDTHINCTIVAADGSESTPTFAVSGTDVISVTPAPQTGENLVVFRETPLTQETDYQPNDEFPAESHEGALDKLTLIVQDQQRESDLFVRVPADSTGGITIPEPVDGQTIIGESGNYVAGPTADEIENAQESAESAEADRILAEAAADEAQAAADSVGKGFVGLNLVPAFMLKQGAFTDIGQAAGDLVALDSSGKIDASLVPILDEDDFASDSAEQAPSQQSTKAFVNNLLGNLEVIAEGYFDGTGATGAKATTNTSGISAISKASTGQYSLTLSTAVADASKLMVMSTYAFTGAGSNYASARVDNFATTGFDLDTFNQGGSYQDCDRLQFIVLYRS